jgi:diguanylate cyclase (GGDEF)-like protein
MNNRCNTLLDKLVSLVSKDDIQDVTSIVNMLTTINNFKYSIDNNAPIENLYKKIAYELQVEFKIFDFNIILTKDGLNEELYSLGTKSYNHSFKYPVDKNDYIIINIYKDDLTPFLEMSMNTYFEDLSQILFLRFIVENNQSSMIDPLTKLTNRISFQEEMKTLIPLTIRENMNIGVLLINIDRFTAVNDEHGNEFGDKFLKHFADTIKKTIRSSDMAVRFSGGEFLVLLVNVESENKTIEIANKIKDILAEEFILSPNGDQFKKTVCIGVSMFPQDSRDIHDVVKKSEIALSDARDLGRNRVQRFSESEESPIELF